MNCGRCGKPVAPGARFCTACGAPAGSMNPYPGGGNPAPGGPFPGGTNPAPGGPYPGGANPAPARDTNRGVRAVIIAGVAAILVLVIGITVLSLAIISRIRERQNAADAASVRTQGSARADVTDDGSIDDAGGGMTLPEDEEEEEDDPAGSVTQGSAFEAPVSYIPFADDLSSFEGYDGKMRIISAAHETVTLDGMSMVRAYNLDRSIMMVVMGTYDMYLWRNGELSLLVQGATDVVFDEKGEHIVYTTERPGFVSRGCPLYYPDGEEGVYIAESAGMPALSPDGNTLVYPTDEGLICRDMSTGREREIASGPDLSPVFVTNDAKQIYYLFAEPDDEIVGLKKTLYVCEEGEDEARCLGRAGEQYQYLHFNMDGSELIYYDETEKAFFYYADVRDPVYLNKAESIRFVRPQGTAFSYRWGDYVPCYRYGLHSFRDALLRFGEVDPTVYMLREDGSLDVLITHSEGEQFLSDGKTLVFRNGNDVQWMDLTDPHRERVPIHRTQGIEGFLYGKESATLVYRTRDGHLHRKSGSAESERLTGERGLDHDGDNYGDFWCYEEALDTICFVQGGVLFAAKGGGPAKAVSLTTGDRVVSVKDASGMQAGIFATTLSDTQDRAIWFSPDGVNFRLVAGDTGA